VYNGNTNATVTLTDNRVAGDVLTTSYNPVRRSLTRTSVRPRRSTSAESSISGTDAGNYIQQANTTATTQPPNITTRALTVSATGVNKVYDGPLPPP